MQSEDMRDQEEIVQISELTPGRSAPRVIPTTIVESDPPETFAYLRAYLQILARRRWTVLTIALVIMTIFALISFKMRPVFRATGRVAVENESPQVQSLNDLDRVLPTDTTFLETQVNILKSDNLAWQTIEQLRLGNQKDFNELAGEDNPPTQNSMVAIRNRLTREFERHLTVSLMRDSRVLEINFESTNPQLAARTVNALVGNYVEYNFRTKYDATRQATGWMEQQLDELKAKVEKSQQTLVDYEKVNALVSVDGTQDVAQQRLAELSKSLTVAQAERAEKEARSQMIGSDQPKSSLLEDNELLQHLEEKRADLSNVYVEALGQYGPNFPKVVRLKNQLSEIQSRISEEDKRTVERIRSDFETAVQRERLLSVEVGKQKAEVERLNQLLIQHNILKRDFEANQQLYESLLKHLKDATVTAGLRATNVQIVDQAQPPVTPIRPKKLLNIALGLAVGLIVGITLAFVQESLDNSVRTTDDVERITGLPALAVVPELSSLRPCPYWPQQVAKDGANGNGKVSLAVLKQPRSPLAESYRSLRTAVLLSTAPRPPKVVLVTSSHPGEGKTTTALNLALTFAQRGSQVLLVDADLRRPNIASALGLKSSRGLSGYLTGAYNLELALYEYESQPGLWVMPAGPLPPNPADLLSSPTMERLLLQLRARFDHIVIDSPPLLLVADAAILSPLTDGTILVAQSGGTNRAEVTRSCRILDAAGARTLGAVLNRLDARHDGYYGYNRKFGYYYKEHIENN